MGSHFPPGEHIPERSGGAESARGTCSVYRLLAASELLHTVPTYIAPKPSKLGGMAKKKNKKNLDVPAGMSRRQAKLAARAAERAALTVDPCVFRGVAAEFDLIALREFVASATFPITVAGPEGDVEVNVCTVLPGAIPALRFEEEFGGTRLVAVQSPTPSNDPARDVAAAIEWVVQAKPGENARKVEVTESTPQLSDYLSATDLPEITAHDNFNWWIPEGADLNPQMAQGINAANEAMMVSRRLDTELGAAWWTDSGDKGFVRWVRPEDEDDIFRALVKLHAAGHLTLGEGSRYAGLFRAYGRIVPVFEVELGEPAEYWQAALDALGERIAEAIEDKSALTAEERKSRNLLNSRQITIR